MCNQLLKLERDLFGLLDGPWGAADNTAHRRTWTTSVRASCSQHTNSKLVQALRCRNPVALQPRKYALLQLHRCTASSA